MILIFGGAYQGKLDYAKEKFKIKTICNCSDGRKPDFSCDCIYGLEGFALQCAKEGREAEDFFKENRELWREADEGQAHKGVGQKVFICRDVSQGLVPMDSTLREFREINGRMMLYLAGEADEVHRVFCGLGRREK